MVILAVAVVVVVFIAAIATHLLLRWMGRKGWIFYGGDERPRPMSLGLLEEIYQPSVEHVIAQQVTEDTERDAAESGEPETGSFSGP